MKRLNYLALLVLGIVLISCKGNSSESKEAEVKEATTTDCLISELQGLDGGKDIKRKEEKGLFTGVAAEKDQYDSIIKKVEIKNGWLINEIIREKINEKYIINSDYKYENGIKDKGYTLDIQSEEKVSPNFRYVYNMESGYEEGYKVNLYYSEMDNGFVIDFLSKPGKKYNFLNDFEDTEGNDDFSAKGNLAGLTIDELYQRFDAMKKELPHFDYWKN